VDRATVHRWLKDWWFKAAYNRQLLCDERFGGTGVTAANVRQLRAAICRRLDCEVSVADAMTLERAADVLEDIQRVPFPVFNACSQRSHLTL
jgi:hypothetical protein